MPILQYDEYYTRWRKTFSYILSNAGIKRMLPLLEAEASTLCENLHRGGSSIKTRVRSWSLAVPLVATTGQRIETLPPAFADDFIHSQEEMLRFLIPGSAPMVDYFPILKYAPEVFAKWKKEARRVRKLVRASAMAFFLAGKAQFEQMREDPASVRVEGLIARLLREQNTPGVVKSERKFADLELGYIGQTAIGAAADTTAATFMSLMCCFAAFPDVLKKAQEEVDLIAGSQPPTGDMLGQLVYLKACISEVIRATPPFSGLTCANKNRSSAGVPSRRVHFLTRCLRTTAMAATSSPREPHLSPTRGPFTVTRMTTTAQTSSFPSASSSTHTASAVAMAALPQRKTWRRAAAGPSTRLALGDASAPVSSLPSRRSC